MFGLGVGEILLILVVALLVFGPGKLPDLARSIGRTMNEFRRTSRDLRETFEAELHRMEETPPARPEPKIRPEPKLLEAEFEEQRPAGAQPAQASSQPPQAADVSAPPAPQA